MGANHESTKVDLVIFKAANQAAGSIRASFAGILVHPASQITYRMKFRLIALEKYRHHAQPAIPLTLASAPRSIPSHSKRHPPDPHRRPKRRHPRRRRVYCDCGNLAITVKEVKVGCDPQYTVRLPLCPDCLALEQGFAIDG